QPQKEHPQDASTQLLKAANVLVVGFGLDDDTAVVRLLGGGRGEGPRPHREGGRPREGGPGRPTRPPTGAGVAAGGGGTGRRGAGGSRRSRGGRSSRRPRARRPTRSCGSSCRRWNGRSRG